MSPFWIPDPHGFLPLRFRVTPDLETPGTPPPLQALPDDVQRRGPRLEEVSGVFHLHDVGENPFPGTLESRSGEHVAPRARTRAAGVRTAPSVCALPGARLARPLHSLMLPGASWYWGDSLPGEAGAQAAVRTPTSPGPQLRGGPHIGPGGREDRCAGAPPETCPPPAPPGGLPSVGVPA